MINKIESQSVKLSGYLSNAASVAPLDISIDIDSLSSNRPMAFQPLDQRRSRGGFDVHCATTVQPSVRQAPELSAETVDYFQQ